jgi:hypothetical protein
VDFVFAILGADVGCVDVVITVSFNLKFHFVALYHLMVVSVPFAICDLLDIVKYGILQQ